MNDKKLLGREGEAKAARYLEKNGYTVIGLNYTCRFGEIDVIAKKGRFVAFCEVKSRKDARFAEAREFVTASKREKLRKTAAFWLAAHDTDLQPRFDVIEIVGPSDNPVVNHIENAFE